MIRRTATRLTTWKLRVPISVYKRATFSTINVPSFHDVRFSEADQHLFCRYKTVLRINNAGYPFTLISKVMINDSYYNGNQPLANDKQRVSILVEILNLPGSLLNVLKYFWKHDIDLTCIESRPTSADSSAFMVYIDFAGSFK